MALYDFDVTLTLTHTQTIEADSYEDASKKISQLCDQYSFITDMFEELTTDYDSFDDDHLDISNPELSQYEVKPTIRMSDYIKED